MNLNILKVRIFPGAGQVISSLTVGIIEPMKRFGFSPGLGSDCAFLKLIDTKLPEPMVYSYGC